MKWARGGRVPPVRLSFHHSTITAPRTGRTLTSVIGWVAHITQGCPIAPFAIEWSYNRRRNPGPLPTTNDRQLTTDPKKEKAVEIPINGLYLCVT
jgi:hypothetical protein